MYGLVVAPVPEEILRNLEIIWAFLQSPHLSGRELRLLSGGWQIRGAT
jgi:hypothetical protein